MQDSTPLLKHTNFRVETTCQEATDPLYAKGIKMELMPENLRKIEYTGVTDFLVADVEFPTSSDAQIEEMTTKEYQASSGFTRQYHFG